MKIILCDDDPGVVTQLQKLVTEFFKQNKQPSPEITAFFSADDLIDSGLSADIAFLDVEMPGKAALLQAPS